MRKEVSRAAILAGVVVTLGLLATPAGAGEINFEGLAEGQVIDLVTNGTGAKGLPKGSVRVFGFNPAFGTAVNAAIVFDSACPPGGHWTDCSGWDPDLGTPNETFGGPGLGVGGEAGQPFENKVPLGNVAIVAENLIDRNGDGLIDDPDDADLDGEFIEFDFRGLKGGKTTVNSITYVDNDGGEDAQIEFYGPGTLNPSTIALMKLGDNGVGTFEPGIEDITHMRVVLDGSGAVEGPVIGEKVRRPCWVTTGGFNKGEISRDDPSGAKICTFGGNVGPPPSGAFEVNWHDGPLAGARFHTNSIRAVRCANEDTTGPGQPGGKKGFEIDTLYFECDGRFNGGWGYTCDGFLQDGGEPGGKKGNDPDKIQLIVYGPGGGMVGQCTGILSGGNVQLHPPVGKP